MTFRIAHISDLHFGATDAAVVEGLVGTLEALAPDTVVVSGDLTQRALEREFREAAAFIDRLTAPVVVVPGNHDLPGWNVWGRMLSAYRHYRQYVSPELDLVRTIGKVHFVGLNSARRLHARLDWSHGAVSAGQIDYLENEMAAAPDDALRVLVVHHPVVPPFDRPRQTLVRGSRRLARTLSHQKADLVLTGHLHVPQARLLGDWHGDVPHDLPIVQSGTTTSVRRRGFDNCLLLITWEGDRLDVEAQYWREDRFRDEPLAQFVRTNTEGWRHAD